MKVPPKRKGNPHPETHSRTDHLSLNESPSEKEGKYPASITRTGWAFSLNESPSEKEGKSGLLSHSSLHLYCLNESPSEKEGK